VREASRPDARISLVIVFREGLLARIGPSIAPKLRNLAGELGAVPLCATEDYQASWSRAFDVPKGAATFLVDADGKLAWERRGRMDPDHLAGALAGLLAPSGGPSGRLLRLAVGPGDSAPDFLFEFSRGKRMALRKLRGRRVLLNFWQSWSAPCLTELRRLHDLYERFGPEGLVILAIQGDRDVRRRNVIRKEFDLDFPLVPDGKGAIAWRYGVRCWPTTISIDEGGRVQRISMGIGQEPTAATTRTHRRPKK
jgi:peroxiredoxin